MIFCTVAVDGDALATSHASRAELVEGYGDEEDLPTFGQGEVIAA